MSWFRIDNIVIEDSCDWKETANLNFRVYNDDSPDSHFIQIVVRWRERYSAAAWNTIYDNTGSEPLVASGDYTYVSDSFEMPNYDVEIAIITYRNDGGWTPDVNTEEYEPDLDVPATSSSAASGIDNVSAYLNGDTTYWRDQYRFRYRKTGSATWLYTSLNYDSGSTAFSALVSGLDICTEYEFSAMAHNAAGWGYGSTLTFTTTGSVPTMWTKAATGIDNVSAFLVGRMMNDNDGTVDEYGFDYGLTVSYGSSATTAGALAEGIDFMKLISSLSNDTTYHYRAKAHTVCGWGYGNDKEFRTMPTIPAIDPSGYIWIDQYDECIHYIDAADKHWTLTGFTKGGATGQAAGYLWIEGTQLHYIDNDGDEWYAEGDTFAGSATGAVTGYIWISTDTYLHYIDSSGNERRFD